MSRFKFTLPIIALLLAHNPALAQDQVYQPDILSLDGQTSLVFPTESHLSVINGGTIEFWTAPNWDETPAYNPVLFSHMSNEGILYEIALQADKKALLLTSGEALGIFAFDFDDRAVHHVAIVNLNDSVVVMIDGQFIGASALRLADLQPSHLTIGSGRGGALPFSGVIAGLRIWQAALDPETLVEYNWEDATAENTDHPYAPMLAGYSEFETQDFVIIDKPVIPSWISPDLETLK